MSKYHNFWMKRAIWIAKKEILKNKIPIGSIIVWNNFEIGIGCNFKQFNYYSLAHAEIIALKQGAFYSSNRIIRASIIYVTLKPCFICINSLKLFKIKQIIFGINYLNYNKNYDITKNIKFAGGILEKDCKKLMENFYLNNSSPNNKLYL